MMRCRLHILLLLLVLLGLMSLASCRTPLPNEQATNPSPTPASDGTITSGDGEAMSPKSNDQTADPSPTPASDGTITSGGSETMSPKSSDKTDKRVVTADDLEIVTLLPKDAIRSIDDPQFLTANEADDEYSKDELVLGISINNDLRAYSVPFLSSREIVNDVVGGKPIAVTW